MTQHSIKMPDIGEGVAEAEIVEWAVEVGSVVVEDDVLASVMTDKATVEIPAPVDGTVSWLGADVGEMIAVGTELVRIETSGVAPDQMEDGNADEPPTPEVPKPGPSETKPLKRDKVLASPAVRARAKKEGVDLTAVHGSAAGGRIRQSDLSAYLERGDHSSAPMAARKSKLPSYIPLKSPSKDVPLRGLRRTIAERLALSASHIPHITYVDEVDVTALDDVRAQLNRDRKDGQPKLTILPFLIRALVKAIEDSPAVNAHYDESRETVHVYEPVHVGIATQTDDGLKVPVLKDAGAMGLWAAARAIAAAAEGARDGTLAREQLTGSTITITSLGALGGLVSTPIINHPEVAILGINKMETRPHWDGIQFVPRKKMNLSASFDHRIIDGYDAALFIQRIKSLLEAPVQMFIDDDEQV